MGPFSPETIADIDREAREWRSFVDARAVAMTTGAREEMSTALRAAVCRKLGLSATATQADVYRAALKKIGAFADVSVTGHYAPKAKYPNLKVGDVVVDEGGTRIRVTRIGKTYGGPGIGPEVVEIDGTIQRMSKMAAFGEWANMPRSPENDKKAQRLYANAKGKLDELTRDVNSAERNYRRAQDAPPGTYSQRDIDRSVADYEQAKAKRRKAEELVDDLEAYARQRG